MPICNPIFFYVIISKIRKLEETFSLLKQGEWVCIFVNISMLKILIL